MIRRLDSAAKEVHERLGNGPLTTDERRTLEETLGRLLPMVADHLQDTADAEAAIALAQQLRRQ